MRVISGKLKGRNIKGYQIDGTRPTMDRVKESVFASIQDYLEDSVVLDLFAGSGNLGIEAISNGVLKCYFVDNNHECVKTIKENIKEFGIESQAVVIEKDYQKALDYFKDNQIVFDVILVDPPYRYEVIEEIVEYVYQNHLLSDQGIMVLEYQKMNDRKIDEHYQLLRCKKYGDKYVSIYQLNC